jgi:hypothetical protein
MFVGVSRMFFSTSSRARRWRAAAATVGTAALVALSVPAFADGIVNTLDGTIDSVAEVMPLNVGGSDGTTQLYIDPANGDGKQGCNLTGSTTVTVNVVSSNPAAATVSPSSVTFTSCVGATAQNLPTLTVTPVATGSSTISLTQASNTTAGTFDLTPATFTVNVASPANTAPTISVDGVTAGGSYAKGSVPTATCHVTDSEDGNSTFPATLSAITGDFAADGIGSQTASCSYTDAGHLTASASKTYSIVDPSGPSIGYTLNPAAPPSGSNGWYTGDVTLTWHVTEPESPSSLQKTGCVDQNITADQVATTYSCSATSAGGSASEVSVTIKRDANGPQVSYTSAAGTEGNNGWYTSDVTATFTATDAFSGPASQTGTSISSGEGSAVQVSSPAFSDGAGNTTAAGAASQSFKIDKSGPTITGSADRAANAHSWYNADVTVTFVCSDAVSGIDTCVADGESDDHKTLGQGEDQTVSGTATDNAGLTSTDSVTGINIDKTAPTVSLVGGPSDNGTYYYGFVPATPTCDAFDGLSGLDGSCSVTGYSTALGSHTVTASVTDNAGNTSSASATYTVNAWTLTGFYAPVDLHGTLNTVKGGSTVPLKFEIFAGSTELTDTAYVKSFTTKKIACDGTNPEDAVEVTSTGGTSLRYDATGGQFIQNWKTPTGQAGSCFQATMTTQDGGTINALFKMK